MASLRKAIDDHCRDCLYDKTGYGSAAQQIEACTAFQCKLWPVRPVRNRKHPAWVPWTEKLLVSMVDLLKLTREQVLAWCENPREFPPGFEPSTEPEEAGAYIPEDDPDSPI